MSYLVGVIMTAVSLAGIILITRAMGAVARDLWVLVFSPVSTVEPPEVPRLPHCASCGASFMGSADRCTRCRGMACACGRAKQPERADCGRPSCKRNTTMRRTSRPNVISIKRRKKA